MRTPQEALRDALPAIQAAADGKAIEYNNGSGWKVVLNIDCWDFADPDTAWRIKPEPKRTLRPWKPEEVPVGALVRTSQTGQPYRWLIVAVCGDGITTCGGDSTKTQPASHFAICCDHSTDGGKTWHPCGVWEVEA